MIHACLNKEEQREKDRERGRKREPAEKMRTTNKSIGYYKEADKRNRQKTMRIGVLVVGVIVACLVLSHYSVPTPYVLSQVSPTKISSSFEPEVSLYINFILCFPFCALCTSAFAYIFLVTLKIELAVSMLSMLLKVKKERA